MKTEKKTTIWPYAVAIPIGLLCIHLIKASGVPDFNFGAVSNSMDSTTAIAVIGPNMTSVEFEVENQSTYGYIDLVLDCTYQGSSGTEIQSQTITIYETFKPRSAQKVTIPRINIPSQSATMACVPEDATLVSQIRCSHSLNAADEFTKTCSEHPLVSD